MVVTVHDLQPVPEHGMLGAANMPGILMLYCYIYFSTAR